MKDFLIRYHLISRSVVCERVRAESLRDAQQKSSYSENVPGFDIVEKHKITTIPTESVVYMEVIDVEADKNTIWID